MKARRQSGFSLFELMIIVCVMIILAAIWVHYSKSVVENAENVALKTIGRSFSSSMSSLRRKWMLEGGSSHPQEMFVFLNQQPVYINEFGWPANTSAAQTAATGSQTPLECLQLWGIIMQNTIPATLEGAGKRREQRFHISTPDKNRCRFELAHMAEGTHFFDYNLITGEVDIHLPPSI